MHTLAPAVRGHTPHTTSHVNNPLLTSSAGLQQEGIPVVPEIHASIGQLVNGRYLSLQAEAGEGEGLNRQLPEAIQDSTFLALVL